MPAETAQCGTSRAVEDSVMGADANLIHTTNGSANGDGGAHPRADALATGTTRRGVSVFAGDDTRTSDSEEDDGIDDDDDDDDDGVNGQGMEDVAAPRVNNDAPAAASPALDSSSRSAESGGLNDNRATAASPMHRSSQATRGGSAMMQLHANSPSTAGRHALGSERGRAFNVSNSGGSGSGSGGGAAGRADGYHTPSGGGGGAGPSSSSSLDAHSAVPTRDVKSPRERLVLCHRALGSIVSAIDAVDEAARA